MFTSFSVHHGNDDEYGISVFVIIIAALNLFLTLTESKGVEQKNAQIHGVV
jgi:hypothetical protein